MNRYQHQHGCASVTRLAWALDTARYYLAHRRWLALARELWTRSVLGHNGEHCEVCGRRYLLWHADDALYAKIIGSSEPGKSGLFCPACFTVRAANIGVRLIWTPQTLADYQSNSGRRPSRYQHQHGGRP